MPLVLIPVDDYFLLFSTATPVEGQANDGQAKKDLYYGKKGQNHHMINGHRFRPNLDIFKVDALCEIGIQKE
jgi:hypothetical protein